MRVFWGILVCVAQQASAAPINCDKAITKIELQICASSTLRRLDMAVDRNYQGSMATDIGSQARNHLIRTQRDWLLKRNDCLDVFCIEKTYRERVDALCEYPAIRGVNWGCKIRSDEVE